MENWKKWEPILISDRCYELIALQQDRNGLKLIYEDDNEIIEVVFKEELLSFRSCDEGNRWKTIDNVLDKNGVDYFVNELFFIVENSEFKNWFIEENYSNYSKDEFLHYAFVTPNDVVDVLALHAPEVKKYHR